MRQGEYCTVVMAHPCTILVFDREQGAGVKCEIFCVFLVRSRRATMCSVAAIYPVSDEGLRKRKNTVLMLRSSSKSSPCRKTETRKILSFIYT